MFGRLLQWIANRLRQSQRAIFRYWDGAKERAIDPFVAWKALQDDPEYVSSKHDAAVDRGELEAQEITQRAVLRAFGVKPFDQGGLTCSESLGLLVAFYDYLEELKKNTATPLTLPVPTESASSPTNSTTNAA